MGHHAPVEKLGPWIMVVGVVGIEDVEHGEVAPCLTQEGTGTVDLGRRPRRARHFSIGEAPQSRQIGERDALRSFGIDIELAISPKPCTQDHPTPQAQTELAFIREFKTHIRPPTPAVGVGCGPHQSEGRSIRIGSATFSAMAPNNLLPAKTAR